MAKRIISILCSILVAFSFINIFSVTSFSLPQDYQANVTQFKTGEMITLPEGKSYIYFVNDTDETVVFNIISPPGTPVRDIAITYENDPSASTNITLAPGGSSSWGPTGGTKFRMVKNVKNDIIVPDPVDNENIHEHIHDWIEGEIYSATKEKDGLGGIYCKSCGAIQNSYPISAYGYSINDYATPMINSSWAGQTVTFELGEWNSFPKAFMEKIAAKSLEGVSFVFHYKWNHEKQEITIPYGTIVDTSLDWYGPAKMAELYGAN